MEASPTRRILRRIMRPALLLAAGGLAGPPGRAEVVAVSSVVFNNYTRQREADRSFKPEYYVFGEGGCVTRLVNDPAMGRLTFAKIGRIIAAPLAQENYRPALSTAEAQLLIVVFWGSTQGSRESDPGNSTELAAAAVADYNRATVDTSTGKPGGAGAAVNQNSAEGAAYEAALWQLGVANAQRDRLDATNARILGYDESMRRAVFSQHLSTSQDVLQEISNNRYFVVLQAYDFPTAVKTKKLKPMWTVRLSVSEGGDFVTALDQMAWSATRYFGRESDGLQRHRVKEGSVELAPLKVLDAVPAKPADQAGK